jgi:hypothetical protein
MSSAIDEIYSLYQDTFQYLDRGSYRDEFYKAALLLAKLYMQHTPLFDQKDISNNVKTILQEELEYTKENFGEESDEYIHLKNAMKQKRQKAVTDFFKPKDSTKRKREDEDTDPDFKTHPTKRQNINE